MAITQETVDAVHKRANFRCEICNTWLGVHRGQLHHCLLHKSKKHPEYDHEINLQLVCPVCHSEKANTRDNENRHYTIVCKEYGQENVEAWINSLGLKSREYWKIVPF